MQFSWGLLVPVFLVLISAFNLYDELRVRLLQQRGTLTTGRVLAVKRVLPKGIKLFPDNPKDLVGEKQKSCDYILAVSYRLSDGTEATVDSLVVPGMIRISEGERKPLFEEGMEVPVRYWEKHNRQVVIAHPEVTKRQLRIWSVVRWTVCTLLMLALLLFVLFGE